MEIRIRHLTKTFRTPEGEVAALRDVTVDVPAHRVTTLLGPSGCGKTTLLRCIAGLESPDAGEIAFGDQVVWSGGHGGPSRFVPPDKRGVGMVFQTYAIWPHMTVFENVAYPLEARGLSRPEITRRVREALEFVQMGGFERRPATALSGGQQQRVALARALVFRPRIVLFDEPLSNLDAKLREETRRELRRLLTQLGITALYVTHDRFEALALSDLIMVMKDGSIVETGTPQDIFFRPRSRFVVEFLGGTNFVEGTVLGRVGDRLTVATPLGALLCEGHDRVQAGSRVTVYVRTDAIRPAGPEDAGRPNVVRGRLQSLVFLGDHYDADLVVGPVRLAIRLDSRHPVPAEEQELTMVIEPAGCRILDGAR